MHGGLDFLVRGTHLPGFDGELAGQRIKPLAPPFLRPRGRGIRHENPAAVAELDDPFVIELAISLYDRRRVDRQVFRKLADRWKLIARRKRARRHIVADLIHQLPVNRNAGLDIELEMKHFETVFGCMVTAIQ